MLAVLGSIHVLMHNEGAGGSAQYLAPLVAVLALIDPVEPMDRVPEHQALELDSKALALSRSNRKSRAERLGMTYRPQMLLIERS